MSADNIHFFITLREQIKLYHWQTKIYSRHKATDSIIEELDKNIDKYGRAKLTSRNNTIKLQNLSEASIIKFVRQCIQHLKNNLVSKLSPHDTDLVNIRDEILGDLDQLLYLFTLH